MSFRFLDPGALTDGELELVAPDLRWVDALMEAVQHPLTVRDAAALSRTTRQQLFDFLKHNPRGQQPANPAAGTVPSYHFWMHLRAPLAAGPIAGAIALRIGQTHDLEMYVGHIGYHVYPPARGRRLAERACRLLLPLARAHGMTTLWITANPDNVPSRLTLERLGATMVGTVALPADHGLYAMGERFKCRYRLDL